jgi:hypothetical protein
VPFFTQQFSLTGTRDEDHPGLESLQLDNLSESHAVGFEAPPSANSDPAFLVQDWNVDGHDCNVAPNI